MCACCRQIRLDIPTNLHDRLVALRRSHGLTLRAALVAACSEFLDRCVPALDTTRDQPDPRKEVRDE